MRTLSFLLSFLLPVTAFAQEVPDTVPTSEEFALPEVGEILPLRRGTAAPHDGLLIGADDMLQIQMSYDRMVYLLRRTTERERETCDVRVEMEHARLSACEERLRLRDELWGARRTELEAQVVTANEAARHAAERGWWESEILWFILGVAATSVVWIAATVR